MLIAGSRLIDAPVMGLQTGSELARTSKAIIDPRTLEIVAYEVTGPLLNMRPSALRIADVREFSEIGLIVDSSDEFVSPIDIIKLNEIYKLNFGLIGMQVVDEKKRKLGKVDGYTIETGGFLIQQLSVKRPLLKSFNDTQLLIHRTQITEINNSAIVVNSEVKVQPLLQTNSPSYHNPFRKNPGAQAEHMEQD